MERHRKKLLMGEVNDFLCTTTCFADFDDLHLACTSTMVVICIRCVSSNEKKRRQGSPVRIRSQGILITIESLKFIRQRDSSEPDIVIQAESSHVLGKNAINLRQEC
ncbi:hypothetical protein ANTQUA_LOCUS6776 [Anthophora quadrimaculata]